MMSLTRRSSKDLERYLLHSASRTLAAVLVAAAWPVAAFADEPQLREAIEYYEITGKTARQLREAMDRSGPIGSDGKRFDGHTGWWIEHNFGLQETVRSISRGIWQLVASGPPIRNLRRVGLWACRHMGYCSRHGAVSRQ